MTVKVITPGREQNPTLRGSCHVCGCLVECLKSDLTYEDRPCSEGYVQCPTKGCYGHIIESKLQILPSKS